MSLVFGSCEKHPNFSMANCPVCLMEQKNEVIARFMGMKPVYSGVEISGWEDETGRMIILGSYKPNEDWNELMPVIEKISKWPLLNSDGTPCTDSNDTCYPLTFNMPVPNEEGKVMFRFKGHTLHFGEKLIDVCFHAVYDAIQFYNEQTTQP